MSGQVHTPVVGDSVILGFTGGSSEFPHILGHFPGKASSAAAQTAVAPAPASPSQIQSAAFKPLGTDLSDVMNIAGGFRSVASFASLFDSGIFSLLGSRSQFNYLSVYRICLLKITPN